MYSLLAVIQLALQDLSVMLHGGQISGLHVRLLGVRVGKVGVGWAIGQGLHLCSVHFVM